MRGALRVSVLELREPYPGQVTARAMFKVQTSGALRALIQRPSLRGLRLRLNPGRL